MPRILTVDDSRAIRMIVTKQVTQLGFEVEEAEDGQQGLARIANSTFDLVILDVTMPVLDGPGMLEKLRASGDKTPVLMLTSESKRSIVSGLMKLGISDYILKPFKPEELFAKIKKILKLETPAGAGAGSGAAAIPDGSRPACNLLIVDDMENVSKRLRQLIPEHITMASATTANAAMALAREKDFRVILLDNEIPDTDTQNLVRSLRLLQPNAACCLLALRSANNVRSEAQSMGFETVLFKPFTTEEVDELVLRYFENQNLVSMQDNVLRVEPFKGKEDRLAGYFTRVTALATKTVEEIAAACFGEVVMDATRIPVTPNKTAQLIAEVEGQAKRMGLELRLVGPAELTRALHQYAETKDVPVFATVAAAQSGA